jgi:ABC-type sugar transport system permease subunit
MNQGSTGSTGTYHPRSRVWPPVRRRSLRVPSGLQGYLFIAPWIIGLLCFQALPILASLWISLTKWDGMTPAQFIGLRQYQAMLNDPLFSRVLLNTISYVAMAVPLQLVLALFLALLLNRPSPATPLFRAVLYLPSVIPGAALAVIWMFMFNPTYGAHRPRSAQGGGEGGA